MKALILAAGIGKRLKTDTPKILLQIGKKTLLERHYTNLVNANIHKIGLVVGFQNKKIEDLIKRIDKENRIIIFRNREFRKGSAISLVSAYEFFDIKEEMILMDGDVLYHAIVDACLGAIAKGDIGQHFPSSDNKWKNENSQIFLEKVSSLIIEKGYSINNISS